KFTVSVVIAHCHITEDVELTPTIWLRQFYAPGRLDEIELVAEYLRATGSTEEQAANTSRHLLSQPTTGSSTVIKFLDIEANDVTEANEAINDRLATIRGVI